MTIREKIDEIIDRYYDDEEDRYSTHREDEVKNHFMKDELKIFLTSNNIEHKIQFDYGYENSFSRQIQANANEGDVFIAISTSGNSKNIVKAILEAKKKNVTTIGLVGQKACEMDSLCDYIIKVPSESTPTIQESHIMIGHIICALVEEAMFKGENVCLSGQKLH